jgi:hypothetical protein
MLHSSRRSIGATPGPTEDRILAGGVDRSSRGRSLRGLSRDVRAEASTRNGGERGIRTLEAVLAPTRFPIVLLQPLGHLSALPGACGHADSGPGTLPVGRAARQAFAVFSWDTYGVPYLTRIAPHEFDAITFKRFSLMNPSMSPSLFISSTPRRSLANDA